MLGYHPPGADTPSEQTPPEWTPPEQTPPGADTPPPGSRHPQEQTPPQEADTPGADTPWSRHPPRSRHPPEQTPREQKPPSPRDTGMHSCFCSGFCFMTPGTYHFQNKIFVVCWWLLRKIRSTVESSKYATNKGSTSLTNKVRVDLILVGGFQNKLPF